MTAHAATRASFLALTLAFAALVVLSTVSETSRAHAQQGPQPLEVGEKIIFDQCTIVSVTVLESDAKFTNVFWRFDGSPGGLGITSKEVGKTLPIGVIQPNQELILGIKVDGVPENVFMTGPGDRNPDGQVHAEILGLPIGTGTTVGFEDKQEFDPFYDFDYDDAVLELMTSPCPPPQQVTLTVQIDPASTGTGGVAGGGTYDLGVVANASASPAAGSSFGGWSQDCGGFNNATAVVMDANKTCVALFLAGSTSTSTPTATPPPPLAGPPPTIDISNTRTSPSPASVGDTVIFRIDTTLTNVPLANEAEVLVTFDDVHLEYIGALTSECTLFPIGIVCDFGSATAGFTFNLDFTALEVTPSTATNATLGADYDGAGPGAAALAGPASANVAIVDVEGIQLPPLGDGSAAGVGGQTSSGALTGILGIIVLGAMGGASLGMTRRRSATG